MLYEPETVNFCLATQPSETKLPDDLVIVDGDPFTNEMTLAIGPVIGVVGSVETL